MERLRGLIVVDGPASYFLNYGWGALVGGRPFQDADAPNS